MITGIERLNSRARVRANSLQAMYNVLMRPALLAGVFLAALALTRHAEANSLILRGKVVMEDGSPPNRSIGIERFCHDTGGQRESQTDKKGDYAWVMEINPLTYRSCVLRASYAGYDSTVIDIAGFDWFTDPVLPTLVLRKREAGSADQSTNIFYEDGIPLAARTAWNNAQKLSAKRNWSGAERELRVALKAAPKFTRGWYALGVACSNQNKPAEARDAFQRVVELDPKSLEPYLLLARMSVEARNWPSAEKAAADLIKADTKQRYPEIYLHQATARYYLKDLDGAEKSARAGIELDRKREVPRTEYVLGAILEAKGDLAGAREHFLQYLELSPKAADAGAVRSRVENPGKAPGSNAPPRLEIETVAVSGSVGEAWVPGGMKALAAMVHMQEPPTRFSFFSNYCRAIVREISVGGSGIPQFIPALRLYLATVSELSQLGERREDGTLLTLSLATDERRRQAEHILRLLGWKLGQRDSHVTVEPGDQADDGLRQTIPAALGIDEIRMQETLESGGEFQFELPTENARLAGGEAWSALLKDAPVPPGGIAAALATDWRLTKACAGLGAMSDDAAAALLSAAPLRTLATLYADQLARHGAAFTLSGGSADLPGGPEAAPAWQKLSGANPRNAGPFFRALLDKPLGTLAAFYSVLARSDREHQRFLTKTPARAERFYAWYRQGDEFRNGQSRQVEGWRTEFLQRVPLDSSGGIRFPGGKAAWSASSGSDEEVLLGLAALDAFVPIADIERGRGRPLDQASVKLLIRHYADWKPLFPYFANLKDLGSEDFQDLEQFTAAVRGYNGSALNAVMGEWYSLVELVSQGVRVGSIDQPTAAVTFRQICTELRAVDHSSRALAILRRITGGGDLRESVAGDLLRLDTERRAGFERVLQLQNVPLTADPATAGALLSGLIYAASFDPNGLLINASPRLHRKHQFAPSDRDPKRAGIFATGALVSGESGSYLTGGFANLAELVKHLAPAGRSVSRAVTPVLASGSGSAVPQNGAAIAPDFAPVQADFKTTGRLVEVYATVTDGRGRYVDDLTRADFSLFEQQRAQSITSFEPQSNEVSCVLLLDTTGSMLFALPALKNAALRLISELRPEDSVAVYNFSDSVTERQAFTRDKSAAKRAVLGTQAFGNTALYDALARVGQDLAGRAGKKVIVLFTDGKDNASTLNPETAIERAKALGVPIYTIAQGEAIGDRALLEQLESISKATGGVSFAIEKPTEIGRVFDKVSEELTHGYLLSFQPSGNETSEWRPIRVVIGGSRGLKVRAREGYYPE